MFTIDASITTNCFISSKPCLIYGYNVDRAAEKKYSKFVDMLD
jgi:hypothetical protein